MARQEASRFLNPGTLPFMAYAGRLLPKEVPFQALSI